MAEEAKDNALMTGLMNTVSNNSVTNFIYMFFDQRGSLNNVDLNGNTLLHLAAKSNSFNIAKLLKHIYIDVKNNENSPYLKYLQDRI